MSITERVKNALEDMTKTENNIGKYFLLKPEEFAFGSLCEIAEKMDTSTTSVIRFCKSLGFSGYKEFQNEVRMGFKYEVTLPDKFSRTVNADRGKSQIERTARNTVDCIEQTLNNLSDELLSLAARNIFEAKRVFCFGLRESFALAHYAYTRFISVRKNVFLLSAGQDGEIESVLGIGEGDLCVFFLFHRYTRQAPQMLRLLKKQGVRVILITSPPCEDVEDSADLLLDCAVNIGGIKNSAVAPVCIVDHLCNSIAIEGGEETLKYMERSEELLKNFSL